MWHEINPAKLLCGVLLVVFALVGMWPHATRTRIVQVDMAKITEQLVQHEVKRAGSRALHQTHIKAAVNQVVALLTEYAETHHAVVFVQRTIVAGADDITPWVLTTLFPASSSQDSAHAQG